MNGRADAALMLDTLEHDVIAHAEGNTGDCPVCVAIDSRVLELLESIDDRLARLEAKFDEYEPLIDMVRARADRGAKMRARFGGKPT